MRVLFLADVVAKNIVVRLFSRQRISNHIDFHLLEPGIRIEYTRQSCRLFAVALLRFQDGTVYFSAALSSDSKLQPGVERRMRAKKRIAELCRCYDLEIEKLTGASTISSRCRSKKYSGETVFATKNQ